jgi:ATP-binding cassette subfamily G (WHITE) protein 2 (SNQ2)
MLAHQIINSSFVFQGLIIGSVFLKSPEETSAFFSRGGVLFLYVSIHSSSLNLLLQNNFSSLLFSALSTMAEIPALYSQRPIVNRHQKSALYHPFVEAMALTLVDIPITLLTSTVFSIIIYFMVGLQTSARQFLYVHLIFWFGDADNTHKASSCYSCS